MKKTSVVGVAVGFFLFGWFGIANASNLMGNTINVQYYYDGSAFNSPGSPGSFIVGSTTDTFGNNSGLNLFKISGTASEIIFDFSVSSGTGNFQSPAGFENFYGLSLHNGIVLSDNESAITGVSLDSLTNMAGFTMSNVAFDAHNIALDWAGLTFDSSTKVVLDIASSSVPEPTTMLLFGAGLTGLAVIRRKKIV